MRYLYSAMLWLLLPAVVALLLARGLRNRAYLGRMGERFGFFKTPRRRYDVWIHAASVGEVNAATPLVKALARRHPRRRLLLTTMTPTGRDQVRLTLGERVDHLYLPFDYPFAVESFLDRANPRLAVMVEMAIWPNLIAHGRRRGIPVYVVNLRLTERSLRRYRALQPFTRSVFGSVAGFAVQTEADRERVLQLVGDGNHGSSPKPVVAVTGNVKFEVDLPASLREVAQVVRREWGTERTVWVAGSTHEGEEESLLRVFGSLKRRHPELLLVLVPRYPERFEGVWRLVRRCGFECRRRSAHDGALGAHVEVFLGDTMGELPIFYAACDVAFVGGSLVEVGGHNVLEACALGKPVIFGPHMFNFRDIGAMTLDHGAGVRVADEAQLEEAVERMIGDASYRSGYGENGIALVAGNRGSLRNTLDFLEPCLDDGAGDA